MAELKIEGAGLVIKALREKHGLSLSELAGRLDPESYVPFPSVGVLPLEQPQAITSS